MFIVVGTCIVGEIVVATSDVYPTIMIVQAGVVEACIIMATSEVETCSFII